MPRALVGDINIHYETRGSGPPLLLIMGWQGNLDWWPEELLRNLESGFRLVLFDNRGAGRTGDTPGPYGMGQMADDAAGLLAALDIPRAHVFGVSMGGMIAQELALRHAERVERLILGCTTCGLRHGISGTRALFGEWLRYLVTPKMNFRDFLNYLLFSEDLRGRGDPVFRDFARRAMIAPSTPAAIRKQYGAIFRFDSHARLPQIRQPTLVITGTNDLMVAPGNSRILARRIPDARLVELPGQGHAFMSRNPVEVAGLIRNFLHLDQPQPRAV